MKANRVSHVRILKEGMTEVEWFDTMQRRHVLRVSEDQSAALYYNGEDAASSSSIAVLPMEVLRYLVSLVHA